MKIPYELQTELILIFSGNKEIFERLSPLLWQDPVDIDAILNIIRPFGVLHFSDPQKFLQLLKDSPKELKWAAEKPARVQKCITQLEAVLNPQPLQLPPGGGSMWLGLSSDDPSKDFINND